MKSKKTYQCNKCGATGTDIKAISKGVCHKPIMKTNKLREEFENKFGNDLKSDNPWKYAHPYILPWVEEKIETAIQSEKKKWKQEALKAIPEDVEKYVTSKITQLLDEIPCEEKDLKGIGWKGIRRININTGYNEHIKEVRRWRDKKMEELK